MINDTENIFIRYPETLHKDILNIIVGVLEQLFESYREQCV